MSALKHLSDLDHEARKKRYPNNPEYAIHRRTFSDKTANGLTKCILRWLTLHNHWATRINSTGRMLTEKIPTASGGTINKSRWIPGTTRKGTADIHAVINGRHISIEIKIGKDRMSAHQERTRLQVEASGGRYFIARDFQSFITFYNSIK